MATILKVCFYTPPLDSGRALWFHVGCLCVHPSVSFSFTDDNLSKHQWIFTKLGMCIDIVEVWFGLLMDKFRKFFTELSARDTIMAGYYSLTGFFLLLLK